MCKYYERVVLELEDADPDGVSTTVVARDGITGCRWFSKGEIIVDLRVGDICIFPLDDVKIFIIAQILQAKPLLVWIFGGDEENIFFRHGWVKSKHIKTNNQLAMKC